MPIIDPARALSTSAAAAAPKSTPPGASENDEDWTGDDRENGPEDAGSAPDHDTS